MKRVLTALVLVPFLIFIIGHTPPIYFSILVAISTSLALEEFFSISVKSGFEVHRFWGHFFSLALLGTFYYSPRNQSFSFFVLTIAALTVTALGLRKGDRLRQVLPGSSATFLGLVYISVTLGLLLAVRLTPTIWGDGSRWIFFLLLVVWVGDTAAYYVGSTIGRNKLSPNISPKKTVEGALGGLLGSTLGAYLGHKIFLPLAPLSHLLYLGWIVGAVSQIGDLSESALKRGAGVKDSSNLLPGHGGMLDRIDGVLFASPVIFGYIRFLLDPK